MRALLDVHVLIALLDADHTADRAAITWFGASAAIGWASCPSTQNGCVRIMSHPHVSPLSYGVTFARCFSYHPRYRTYRSRTKLGREMP